MSPGKKNLPSFFALILLVFTIIAPVAADVTLNFVDRSYFGNNPMTISDKNGTEVFNGTTSSKTIELLDNNAYWISFEPGGITDIAKSPDFGASEGFSMVQKFGVGILIVIFILVVVFWRK